MTRKVIYICNNCGKEMTIDETIDTTLVSAKERLDLDFCSYKCIASYFYKESHP